MREILFKAKRVDNGEWVEGLLILMWCQYHIQNSDEESVAYPIDTETLCQYTGITDKNGKKIWENDIVDTYEESSKETLRNVVKFNEGCFKVFKEHYLSMYLDAYNKYDFEVIGNIFDNPELLKED